jgi:hypothetical protein
VISLKMNYELIGESKKDTVGLSGLQQPLQ